MCGKILVYDIEEVSLLDINNLVDKGARFTLLPKEGNEEIEFNSLEDI